MNKAIAAKGQEYGPATLRAATALLVLLASLAASGCTRSSGGSSGSGSSSGSGGSATNAGTGAPRVKPASTAPNILSPPPAPPIRERVSARVVRADSGDHLVARLPDGKTKVIGLWGTDAPEVDRQPFGHEARDYLAQRLRGQTVTLQSMSEGEDPSAKVYLGSKLINEEMVLQGYSWWVPFWAPDSDVLKEAQRTAQTARLGLWRTADPTPPWVYRERRK